MAKYFMFWESDESLWPADPKEQAALGVKLGEMVKQGMKEGRTLDWGIFVGGDRGYAVVEADPVNLYGELQKYHPYVNFEVHPVLTIDQLVAAQQVRMK
jgi:hypothetical protein